MLNRYEDPEVNLPIEERPGPIFLSHADDVYQEITGLLEKGEFRFDKETRKKYDMLKDVAQDSFDMIRAYENARKPFATPQGLLDNYFYAKRQHELTKKNPAFFYKKNDNERDELVQEKQKLAERIERHERDLARLEDKVKHDIKNKRSRYTAELAALKQQKELLRPSYERHTQSCCANSIFFKRERETYESLKDKRTALKEKLDNVGKEVDKEIEDARYELELLTNRRWDVDKELNDIGEAGDDGKQKELWKEAVDDTEVMLYVRRKDIDDAIGRYYAAYNLQLMHALLRLYVLLEDCYEALPDKVKSDALRIAMDHLNEMADTIHAPRIANRTIMTLFKKADMMEGNLMQVVYEEPKEDKLPEVLARTLSVKNLEEHAGGLGIFKKAKPDRLMVSESDSDTEEVVVMSPV